MLTIQLQNLKFHAYHGLYDLEKFSGNTFIIDVDVAVEINDPITRLHQTVNYATVYEIIKMRMQHPTQLLETVAQEIIQLIRNIDDRIRLVNISIKKLSPPIENFQGTVGVKISTSF